MKTIDISIIIATYNSADTLERCLDSIVSQKNNRVELIIIDGLSKDGTIEIIKNYGEQIDYYISENDRGVYDAWNKGLAIAKGNWVEFIGSDDMLLPQSIDAFFDIIDSNDLDNIDLISAKNEYVDQAGTFLRYYGEPFIWKKYRKYMTIAHGSTLHNRNLFNEVGSYNLKFSICGDYELIIRKKSIKSIHVERAILRMQTGGMSFTLKGIIEAFKIRKYHKTVPIQINLYLFVKGIIGFWIRKIKWYFQ